MKYTFSFELQRREDNGRLIDMIGHDLHERQDATWVDLLEEFRRFLSGCGFIIPQGEIEVHELEVE